MSDVFLSYASEDRERAAQLAHALGQQGWSVWWDRKIIAGQAFDQAIERELEAARAVVVLWSADSIASEWVKNEAAVAAERGVLVPALIDNVKLPLEFRRKQTADLVGWQGDEAQAGFQGLCQGVAHAMGAQVPKAQRASAPTPRHVGWVALSLGGLACVLLGLYAVEAWRATPEVPVSAVTSPIDSTTANASRSPVSKAPGLADLVVGTYSGDVIADSKGPSRSDIEVTITRLDRATVRVTSELSRIGVVDVVLNRNGNQIFAADGNSPFIVDLARSPPTLVFDPCGELAYRGTRMP